MVANSHLLGVFEINNHLNTWHPKIYLLFAAQLLHRILSYCCSLSAMKTICIWQPIPCIFTQPFHWKDKNLLHHYRARPRTYFIFSKRAEWRLDCEGICVYLLYAQKRNIVYSAFHYGSGILYFKTAIPLKTPTPLTGDPPNSGPPRVFPPFDPPSLCHS